MSGTVAFATKVLVPRRRAPTLRRPRLFDALYRALDHRIITVVAPAGYGKTTLLAEFAQEVEMPVCWYALDAADGDARTFLGYLIAALRHRFPAWGDRTEALLREADNSPAEITRVVGSLVTEMLEDIPDRFVLVLDDVHVLEDQPATLHALNLLLLHLPENAHLCLAGRAVPELPALPRLVASREVARVRAAALALTDDEVRSLLSDVYGLTLTDEQTAAIIARCEGWAAGVALAALALEDGSAVPGPGADASTAEIFEYLAEEVLARQPDYLQRFLVSSSVLADDLRPDVCAAVLGVPEAAVWLRETEARGLFISSLEGGRAYRFHGLFGDFLQDQLRRQPEAWADLHSRAGRFFAAQQAWSAAVRHFQAAANHEALAEALAAAAPDLYDRGEWRTLADWFDALPRAVVAASAELTLWRAQVALRLGQVDAALPLADHVLATVATPAPNDETRTLAVAEAKSLRAEALRAKEQLAEALALSSDVICSLQPFSSRRAVLTVAEAYHRIGNIMAFRLGRPDEALRPLDDALQRYEALGDRYHLALIHSHLGAACRSLGRFAQALSHFEQASGLAKTLGNPGLHASILNNLGNLYRSRGQYQAATEVLQQAMELAEAAQAPRVTAFAAATLGDAARAQGQFETALDAYQRAAEAAKAASERGLHAYIVAAQGLIYLHLDECAKSSQLILAANELGGGHLGAHNQAFLDLITGIAHLRDGRAGEALPLLAKAVMVWQASHDRENLARASFHQAAAIYTLGNRGEAETQLEEIARIVADLDHGLLLLPEAHLAPGLVEYAAGRGIGNGMYARLWRELAVFGRTTDGEAGAVCPATSPPSGRPRVRAYALGRAEVYLDDQPVDDAKWATQKTRELFYFLLRQPAWVHRDEIIAALWPDYNEARGASVLRTTAYRLRKAMYDECLLRDHSYFRLDPGGEFWLDAAEFERLVEEVQRAGLTDSERQQRLEQAVQLYRGDFLKGINGEWCENTRRKLESHYLTAVTSLAEEHFARGRYAEAARMAQLALEVDLYHEDALALLMESLVLAGERMAALEQYRWYVDRLRADDEEPSPRLQRLAKRIRALLAPTPTP